jgi:hypothetical protein
MPLKRITDQKSRTIEEFYLDLAVEQVAEPWRQSGKAMSTILEQLNKIFNSDTIWCLTSIDRLVLLREDDWRSPWFVIVSSVAGEFLIEYLIPEDSAPWEGARVRGGSTSLDEAVKYILISMKNSGGWEFSIQINAILNSHNKTH